MFLYIIGEGVVGSTWMDHQVGSTVHTPEREREWEFLARKWGQIPINFLFSLVFLPYNCCSLCITMFVWHCRCSPLRRPLRRTWKNCISAIWNHQKTENSVSLVSGNTLTTMSIFQTSSIREQDSTFCKFISWDAKIYSSVRAYCYFWGQCIMIASYLWENLVEEWLDMSVLSRSSGMNLLL